jgi:outer membrane protein assembly factor BamB
MGPARIRLPMVGLALAMSVALFPAPGSAAAPRIAGTSTADWPAYLFGPQHSSDNTAATAITPANAATLARAWTWIPDPPELPGQPDPHLNSSPTVSGGRIYIGTGSGDFYALDLATGQVVWKRFVAFEPASTCGPEGFTSTATVAPDPVSGLPTVYVGAADGYLYALDAADGTTRWRAFVLDPGTNENAGYLWSSPTVVAGRVYIGMASACDNPLIRGGLKSFDQATGRHLATYFSVPPGVTGASIWTTAAATRDGATVFVTTGNDHPGDPPGDSFSFVRLDGVTLARQAKWTVPGLTGVDKDFGSSPTLFAATIGGTRHRMIGACNKNGIYYALDRDDLPSGPVWTRRLGQARFGLCLAAGVWDGSTLYVGSDNTTIGGLNYAGSVRALDPATGAPRWELGLSGSVIGTPTLNGSGVLAAATHLFNTTPNNRAFLIRASDGTVLRTIGTNGDAVFAQPVFADRYLLIATVTQGMRAYTPSG